MPLNFFLFPLSQSFHKKPRQQKGFGMTLFTAFHSIRVPWLRWWVKASMCDSFRGEEPFHSGMAGFPLF